MGAFSIWRLGAWRLGKVVQFVGVTCITSKKVSVATSNSVWLPGITKLGVPSNVLQIWAKPTTPSKFPPSLYRIKYRFKYKVHYSVWNSSGFGNLQMIHDKLNAISVARIPAEDTRIVHTWPRRPLASPAGALTVTLIGARNQYTRAVAFSMTATASPTATLSVYGGTIAESERRLAPLWERKWLIYFMYYWRFYLLIIVRVHSKHYVRQIKIWTHILYSWLYQRPLMLPIQLNSHWILIIQQVLIIKWMKCSYKKPLSRQNQSQWWRWRCCLMGSRWHL